MANKNTLRIILTVVLAAMVLGSCATGKRESRLVQSELEEGGRSILVPFRVEWIHSLAKEIYLSYGTLEFAGPYVDNEHVFIGSSEGTLYALNLYNGHILWSAKAEGGIDSVPVSLENCVIYGDNDGVIHRLSLLDGSELWSYRTKGEILGRPALAGGLVLLTTSINSVIALDSKTGEWKWMYKREITKDITIRGASSPMVYGETVILGFSDGYVVALSLKDGSELWKIRIKEQDQFLDVDAAPHIRADRIFIPSYDGALYCMSAENGALLWKFDRGGTSEVESDDHRVYFSSNDGRVYAVDSDNGEEVWRFDVVEQDLKGQFVTKWRKKRMASGPEIVGDYLVFGSSKGYLYFLEKETGKIAWKFFPGSGVGSTPVFKKGRLFFLTNDANLFCMAPYPYGPPEPGL